MLSKEQNELLTRTAPGTPMGEFIRRYWVPACLSEEVPEPDCPPVQVRILGEALVAFRDSEGRIGLLDEHCSHRQTSLFYGRNEECGLRCIYHGWKYDVEGNVLDTPAEPEPLARDQVDAYGQAGATPMGAAPRRFKDKVKHPAYPTREAAGMVWAYLGPPGSEPLFPNYTWTQVPTENTYVTKALLECNYLQGLEGECDSAHLSFLHRDFREVSSNYSLMDTAPRYRIEETDFGLRFIALRDAGNAKTYVRVSSFIPPITCWVPARGKEVHIYVPIDDTNAWRYDMGFKDRPIRKPEEVHRLAQIGPGYRRIRRQDNHYLQDRQVQRAINFTGIEDYLNHDAVVTETMGAICDRSKEHLGASDTAVIAARRYLLDAVKAFQGGAEPPHLVRDASDNHFEHVDTIAEVVEGDWREHFPHLYPQAVGRAELARR